MVFRSSRYCAKLGARRPLYPGIFFFFFFFSYSSVRSQTVSNRVGWSDGWKRSVVDTADTVGSSVIRCPLMSLLD